MQPMEIDCSQSAFHAYFLHNPHEFSVFGVLFAESFPECGVYSIDS